MVMSARMDTCTAIFAGVLPAVALASWVRGACSHASEEPCGSKVLSDRSVVQVSLGPFHPDTLLSMSNYGLAIKKGSGVPWRKAIAPECGPLPHLTVFFALL